jgi:serine/threonine protein kinase
MSPEVAEKRPYNQGADVFSFGMVLFEILSLTRPKLIQKEEYVDTSRLPMCPCWPESIQQILVQSWSHVISERPTMEDIHVVLKSTISKLESSDSCEGRINIGRRCTSKVSIKIMESDSNSISEGHPPHTFLSCIAIDT